MTAASMLSVLVVDDQKAVRALVRNCLRDMGVHQVGEADNGRLALDVLRHTPRHLVISDLNMPDMTGLDLLREVRADQRLKGMGFIILSAQGEAQLVREAIALGVNNYLMKPFTAALLRNKIEAVVGKLT